MISQAIGEKVEYEPLAPIDYIKRMMKKGWTRDVAEHTAELYRLVIEGAEAEITTDVEAILERKPRRLKAFIQEHTNQFR